MRYGLSRLSAPLLALFLATGALAQDNDEAEVETLDLTMELMPEGAVGTEAVTRVIELPAAAAEAARENAARGLDESNAAREQRDIGTDVADEARERGLERAQQAREDIGRGPPEDVESPGRPESPGSGRGGPPDNPGPPEIPGPPGD